MTISSDKNSFQSIMRMVDSLSSTGNYDTIINILSLMCLFSVLNRNTGTQSAGAPVEAASGGGTNPLQKILGELTKGDGAGALGGALGGPLGGALGAALGSPDMLMSLLPLLNNPQIKSKLNPANIASVMGMLNNLGGSGGEKTDAQKGKVEKFEKQEKKTPNPETPDIAPIEQPTPPPPESLIPKLVEVKNDIPEKEPEKKPGSRFLNWKTNF